MTCAEFEILLCDYLDGTLRGEARTALEGHRSGCAACEQLAEDVAGVTAFVERVPRTVAPAELMTRILHEAPVGRRAVAERLPGDAKPSWVKRLFGGLVHGWLQPRYVMGMAMTILSFSMLARFTHIEPRQLKPSDLDPAKVWQGIDDHSHRMYDRAMKYYDNLRLVIEIQSRLQEWTDQDPGVAGRVNGQAVSGQAAGAQPGAGAGAKRGSQQ